MHNTLIKHIRCQECGEVLTDPESIARGLGPVCANKMATAFATLGKIQEAVRGGYSNTVIESHLRTYETLLRIKKQKEATSGYVSPKLIRDLRIARNTVVRRAQELHLDNLEVAQIIASSQLNFWIEEAA